MTRMNAVDVFMLRPGCLCQRNKRNGADLSLLLSPYRMMPLEKKKKSGDFDRRRRIGEKKLMMGEERGGN